MDRWLLLLVAMPAYVMLWQLAKWCERLGNRIIEIENRLPPSTPDDEAGYPYHYAGAKEEAPPGVLEVPQAPHGVRDVSEG